MKNTLIITGLDSSEKFGGLERWYVQLANMLDEQGNIFLFYNLSMPPEFILEKFSENNISVNIFANKDLKRNSKIYKDFLIKNDISLVIGQFEAALNFLQIPNKTGIKTVWCLYMGNFYAYDTKWKYNLKLYLGVLWYRLQTFRKLFYVNKVYCASEGVQKEFRGFFGHNKKFEVNYLGLDDDILDKYSFVDILTKTKNKTDQIIISCIGFHAPIKGIDIFVRAIAELNERGFDNVLYYQIGSSLISDTAHYTLHLKDLAKSLNVDNLHWKGTQKDVFPFLLQSDVYCQPSRHEALSFTVMEAMTVGLPIVGANNCGIPELVQHDINGYLFNTGDYIDLADKLEVLINSKKIRDEFGVNSFEIIRMNKFRTTTNIKKLIDYLVDS
ncbi:glycosyltransferase family 4 protein [Kaistella sp. 97-N-M2]|uniref:glycosyltransferase family 4 protein n=1 Tax=Kaistella sp. 97-N-M2 TaxID=2908645 RepID=UPI001F2DAD3D|nr:glycosyltransferase family 4 protein [Kaistella sp. 97-N-M2]UJF28771.1 glycosyltransferase family 4 protein [Kaistella sp. 97-N-M2]